MQSPTLYIVKRRLDQLRRMVRGPASGGQVDRHLLLQEMAEYLRFAGAQPAMPMLRGTADSESITDGTKLVEALVLAGWNVPVHSILRAEPGWPKDCDALPFSERTAAALGTSARAIHFERPPSAEELQQLLAMVPAPFVKIGDRCVGWVGGPDEPDWHRWYAAIERYSCTVVPIVALNGRQPTWVTYPVGD